MKMELNGRDSCSQRSRHIDIRYFWIKDRLQNETNKLEYCPTELMLADFYKASARKHVQEIPLCGDGLGSHLGTTEGIS